MPTTVFIHEYYETHTAIKSPLSIFNNKPQLLNINFHGVLA